MSNAVNVVHKSVMVEQDSSIHPVSKQHYKRNRRGKTVIETTNNYRFDSAVHAAQFFDLNYFDVRQYCESIKDGKIINAAAHSRIENRGLKFVYEDDMLGQQVEALRQGEA